MKFKIHFILLVLFIPILNILPQQNKNDNTITLAANEKYKAGWLHELFFGEQWRDLWTTPTTVKILDLNTFAGGLTPFEKGGGQQTKSLKFKGGDGQIWKFRSVQKDPSKVLPPEFRETFVADVLKDMISTSNPFGALVAASLLKEVGVLQAEPYVCYLSDDEKLGTFREDFSNMLGIIEVHPAENEEIGINFGGAEKIAGSYLMFHKIENDYKEKIDLSEFLKARLMDCFMNDWDRHSDQWRWAKYEENEIDLWRPIPRDRDQVFAEYEGLLPSIAQMYINQFTDFDYDYPAPRDLGWNARMLDSRFLHELTKAEWDSVTNFVKSKMTDSVIENAVHQLPKEHFDIAGAEIISKLKSRRDKLGDYSDNYFAWVNKYPDIFAKDKDDYVIVNRKDNLHTEVLCYKKDKNAEQPSGKPFYSKMFDNQLTDEIRIYLLDGDDAAVVKGDVDTGPIIRIIGGEGKDILRDSSIVNGFLFSFLPIKNAETKTYFYDGGKKTEFEKSAGTVIDKTIVPEPESDEERYEWLYKDRHHEWYINPIINFNTDNGIIIGGGPRLFSYNFRMHPCESNITLTASYASIPTSLDVKFDGEFYSIFKGAKINIIADYNEYFFTKYFGYGNETSFSRRLEEHDYYRFEQHLFKLYPSARFSPAKNLFVTAGVTAEYYHNELTHETLLNTFPFEDYGLRNLFILGIKTAVEFDSRDIIQNSEKGLLVKLTSGFYPALFGIRENIFKAGFDTRFFATVNSFTDFTFAFRAGGEKTLGEFPFFMASFLGGKDNLRGFSRERFSGNAALFGQFELRTFLADVKIIIPAKLGVFGFIESGRVFTEDDISKKWHPSYGGGISLSVINREVNFAITIAQSEERTQINFDTAMGF
ncbi:MAG: BamA/TamA family outer membrane protein [bacterium]